MKLTHQSFYKSFYGHKFFRHFRRPPDFQLKGFRIQFTVQTPKELYLHVHRNSCVHPCLIHVYNHGLIGNLKRQDPGRMVFDRVFFDFDVSDPKVKKAKEELVNLRSHGPKFETHRQEELKEEIQEAINYDEIAKPAVDEAKDFALKFKESFGRGPILFFSGCKGAHAYLFFQPTKFININQALSWFAGKIKEEYNYKTLDLAVNKDAQSRLSRVPYSKHQHSGLAVVPFQVDDSYDEIMAKSTSPGIEPFDKTEYLTDFNIHLANIDKVEVYNDKIRKHEQQNRKNLICPGSLGRVDDHRLFFKSILGEPEREYPDKEYVMYKCPFPGHDDNKPSFMVHKTGYKCYGCEKKGNYFQFLKDLNGWSNEQIKNYLRNNRRRELMIN